MVGVLWWRMCLQVGAWTASEFEIHININIKEMIAIFYGLRSFVDKLSGQNVRVQCDNTTAVSVINNMGTTRSPECNTITQKIWQFCRENNIWITCAYIPGSENIFPDIESRKQYKMLNGCWIGNFTYRSLKVFWILPKSWLFCLMHKLSALVICIIQTWSIC